MKIPRISIERLRIRIGRLHLLVVKIDRMVVICVMCTIWWALSWAVRHDIWANYVVWEASCVPGQVTFVDKHYEMPLDCTNGKVVVTRDTKIMLDSLTKVKVTAVCSEKRNGDQTCK